MNVKRYVAATEQELDTYFPEWKQFDRGDIRRSLDGETLLVECDVEADRADQLAKSGLMVMDHKDVIALLSGPAGQGIWYPSSDEE